MSALREEIDRKQELLDRYRTLRLEEILEDLRQRAEQESHNGHFPWKGQFRSRPEIEDLYRQRRRWDRRVIFDLTLLLALCAALLYTAPLLIQILLPG